MRRNLGAALGVIVPVGVMLLPSPVFAVENYYAYYNGLELSNLFNAIALICGDGNYLGLMQALAIAGLLVAVTVGLAKISITEMASYVVGLVLFYGILLVPKVTVVVNDIPLGTNYPVANVPLGIGFFGAEISHIGYWLTNTYEQNVSVPNDVKYSQTGFIFLARMYDSMQRLQIIDPSLSMDFTAFSTDCVAPELADNPTQVSQMGQATDLWGFIGTPGWLNPARFTSFPSIPGSFLECDTDAYNNLNGRLTAEINNQATYLGRKLNPDLYATQTNAAVQAAILAAIPTVEGVIGITARTAENAIQQSLIMNALRTNQGFQASANGTVGDLVGAAASPTNVAYTLSDQAATAAYGTMYQMAQTQLPRIRSLLEGTLVVVFPIVMLMIIMAGMAGGKALQAYFSALLWVQLWAPMFSVVNFFVNSRASAQLDAVLIPVLGAGTTISNTLLNQFSSMTAAQSEAAIAGGMALSVPAIALALATAGVAAAAAAVSSVVGPMSSAASSKAGEVAVGNISGGNLNWGNANMGNTTTSQTNRSFGFTGSDVGREVTASGTRTFDAPSGATTGFTRTGYSLGGQGAVGGQTSSEVASSSATATRAANELSNAFGGRSAAGSVDRSSADFGREMSQAVDQFAIIGTRSNLGTNATFGTRTGRASENSQSQASSDGTSAGASAGAGASTGGGGAGGGGIGGLVQAGVNAGRSASQVLSDIATRRVSGATEAQVQEARQVLRDAAIQTSGKSGDASHQAAGRSFSATMERAFSASDESKAALSRSSEASTRTTLASGTSSIWGANLDAQAWKEGVAMAGSEGAAAQRFNGNTAADAAFVAEAYKRAGAASEALRGHPPQPATQAAVAADGTAALAANTAAGSTAVAQADAGNRSAVAARQMASPTSEADGSAVNADAISTIGYDGGSIGQQSTQATQSYNASRLAAAVYAADHQGAILRALGAGASTPVGLQAAFLKAAEANPSGPIGSIVNSDPKSDLPRLTNTRGNTPNDTLRAIENEIAPPKVVHGTSRGSPR